MYKIFLKAALILMVLTYKVDTYPLKNDGANPTPMVPLALRLPQFQKILASEVHKDLFKPERNSRPLPDVLKSILLPPALVKVKPPKTSVPKTIEVLCHIDRIYVRVLKSMFTNQDAWKYLKVGTCPVNQVTAKHYFFLYHVNSCNVKREENADRVTYSNTLHYEPIVSGPVVWELPFSVPLECHYNKHHRAYQVGFRPEVTVGTMFWSLRAGFSLTSVDATWMSHAHGQSYVIGQPMFFEARAPRHEEGKRLYLDKCFITTSSDPESTPQYVVLDNYGCMLASEGAQMKFYATSEKSTVRFSLKAFMFKDMISQSKKMMFIHCEMSVAPEMPTATTKACTYDSNNKRWSELYGNDSVCSCCDTSCSMPEPSGTVTASDTWELKEDRVEADQAPAPRTFSKETGLEHAGFELVSDPVEE
ncbi:zona pellucida sperm-binding protein 3 [Electrophorus electricus]|uniref:zona pellucida sperm-binding protein 3 n=1 Tax=Electrophorus electricus TaxID=8005 RepID=UPI0015D051A6|nr:zona pellucida sperm-binding protein 3 [Electrophorus electricus]